MNSSSTLISKPQWYSVAKARRIKVWKDSIKLWIQHKTWTPACLDSSYGGETTDGTLSVGITSLLHNTGSFTNTRAWTVSDLYSTKLFKSRPGTGIQTCASQTGLPSKRPLSVCSQDGLLPAQAATERRWRKDLHLHLINSFPEAQPQADVVRESSGCRLSPLRKTRKGGKNYLNLLLPVPFPKGSGSMCHPMVTMPLRLGIFDASVRLVLPSQKLRHQGIFPHMCTKGLHPHYNICALLLGHLPVSRDHGKKSYGPPWYGRRKAPT